ncbi:MAG: FAD-binding oxidoreductase [Candidatus Bathyarchaeota archaeon]|jgi:glycolate oxidase|nr:FAD-binding oxidoreductase [Candidatus Bathyarchaeota archaeon]
MTESELSRNLADIVGENFVTDKLYERKLYDHDIAPLPTEVSFIFKTVPDAVVKPRTIKEVAEVVKYAYSKNIPLVPRGASSWGFGGTIPTQGGIVMELTKINQIISLDIGGFTVTVGAGHRWKMLLDYLEDRGFTLGAYPSSAPSSTVGGWIVTGGMGIGSLKYGPLKEIVQSVKLVTPKGEILILSKENDQALFKSIFGSEGTLGIVVEATIRIIPKPEVVSSQMAVFDTITAMVDAITDVVGHPRKPFFVEILDDDYLDLERSIGEHVPDAKMVAMFVFEGKALEVQVDIEALVRTISDRGGSMLSPEVASVRWEDRFYPMKIRKAGPTLLAGEITHPLSSLVYVIDEIQSIKERHGLKLGIKGLMVDAATVLSMPMYLTDERKRWKFMSILPVVNEITLVGLKAGGRPYGFGIWNTFYFRDVHGEEKVREMKELKRTLDPRDIMNPGKMYQIKTRYGIPLWGTLYRVMTFFLGAMRYF